MAEISMNDLMFRPGLMKGHLARFAPGENAHDFTLPSWVRLCRAALGLMS